MEYHNPEIPEGINTSKESPLKELVLLLAGSLAILAVVAVILGYFGGRLARLIPFETERRWAASFKEPDVARTALDVYLRTLAERTTQAMQLDKEFTITLRYSGDNMVNAFATLGGNVILFRGLLEKLPNEDALLMLLAHEIAHVQHRDPVVSVGRVIGIQTGLGLLLGHSDANVLGSAGLFTMLHFSREMEADADRAALQALVKLTGHVAGALDLFHVLYEERKRMGGGEPPAFFSSHPLDQQRIDRITAAAREHGWSTDGARTSLPGNFSDWLRAEADAARGPGATP